MAELEATGPARLARALVALEGLSVGDAFGEQFFGLLGRHDDPIQRRLLTEPPWPWTDDTNMALSIVAALAAGGAIDQDALMADFARRYDVGRAYGPSMNRMLRLIQEGNAWRELLARQFEGMGSYGNGSAMRIPPLGAYFADDPALAAEQAALAATVTHTHPEGVAGAVAAAVGAAMAWRHGPEIRSGADLLDLALPFVPESEVRSRMRRARALPADMRTLHVALKVGSGSAISCQDTVPFALWCAGAFLHDFERALWETAGGFGDLDTTCAIVGGIVAGAVGVAGIPPAWLAGREPLPAP
ncbi:MAG TPA: ADP-ribosylglycohydrolase family protein [Herpetosiphonaceae bacterium]